MASYCYLAFFAAILSIYLTEILAQKNCIFGKEEECCFPYACNQNTTLYNATTGQCDSGRCNVGYRIQKVKDYKVCEPKRKLKHRDLGVGLYLTKPATAQNKSHTKRTVSTPVIMQRVSDNILEIQLEKGDALHTDCNYPWLNDTSNDTLTESGITYTWEFDLRSNYRLNASFYLNSAYLRRKQRNARITMTFKNTTNDLGMRTNCHVTGSSLLYMSCDDIDMVIARHIYLTIENVDARCVPFKNIEFDYMVGFALDIECSRCLERQDATTCGNGLWCEVCGDGWQAPDCKRPCDPWFYGVNCAKTYSLDWTGFFEVYTSGEDVEVVHECKTMLPPDLNKEVWIEIRRSTSNDSNDDSFETLLTIPYVFDEIQKELISNDMSNHSGILGVQHYYRVRLSTSHPEHKTIYGKPSNIEIPGPRPKPVPHNPPLAVAGTHIPVGVIVLSLIFAGLCLVAILFVSRRIAAKRVSYDHHRENSKTKLSENMELNGFDDDENSPIYNDPDSQPGSRISAVEYCEINDMQGDTCLRSSGAYETVDFDIISTKRSPFEKPSILRRDTNDKSVSNGRSAAPAQSTVSYTDALSPGSDEAHKASIPIPVEPQGFEPNSRNPIICNPVDEGIHLNGTDDNSMDTPAFGDDGYMVPKAHDPAGTKCRESTDADADICEQENDKDSKWMRNTAKKRSEMVNETVNQLPNGTMIGTEGKQPSEPENIYTSPEYDSYSRTDSGFSSSSNRSYLSLINSPTQRPQNETETKFSFANDSTTNKAPKTSAQPTDNNHSNNDKRHMLYVDDHGYSMTVDKSRGIRVALNNPRCLPPIRSSYEIKDTDENNETPVKFTLDDGEYLHPPKSGYDGKSIKDEYLHPPVGGSNGGGQIKDEYLTPPQTGPKDVGRNGFNMPQYANGTFDNDATYERSQPCEHVALCSEYEQLNNAVTEC